MPVMTKDQARDAIVAAITAAGGEITRNQLNAALEAAGNEAALAHLLTVTRSPEFKKFVRAVDLNTMPEEVIRLNVSGS